MFRSSITLGVILFTSSAFAADLGHFKKPYLPAPQISKACKENKALPADVFGFSTGSDVADLGSWGLGLDQAYVRGYRGADAYTYTPTLQISGSFLPCFEVGPYITGSYGESKSYDTASGKTTASSIGGGVEMKYKLLGRSTHGVGLTISANPNAQATELKNDLTSDKFKPSIYANTFRVLADAELMRDRLYGAVNVEFSQAWAKASGNTDNSSGLAFRAALTTPLTSSFYVGAEASHQRVYTGAALNNFGAQATYIGPTFFWQVNDKLSLNGAWAYQVAGKTKGAGGAQLAIDTLPRHQAKIKLGYAF